MEYQETTRRAFIRKNMGIVAVVLSGGILAGSCNDSKQEKKEKPTTSSTEPCQDLSDVSEEEIQKRENLGYVPESPIADNKCNNCNLHIPSGPDKACGGCMLFKGPIEAEGYCTYWAPVI